MALNRQQKKYLKKHLRKEALDRIAGDLGVSSIELQNYLKRKWGKDKYRKFLGRLPDSPPKGSSPKISPPDFKSWLKRHRRPLIFLTLLVIVIYANSLGNDFVSDDIGAIAQNDRLGTEGYIFSDPLRLVHRLIYAVTNQIFGPNPAVYRAGNILFHLGTVLVSYFLICLLVGGTTAFLATALVAAHPIMTEAVTWISGGSYTRYSFFGLASFLSYLLSAKNGRVKYYFLSITLFILALLSSEKAVALPAILLTYEVTNKSISRNWKKLFIPFALSSLWVVLGLRDVASRIQTLQTSFYQGSQTANPLVQIPIAISSYLELILWPKNLTLYHSEMSFSSTEFLIRLAVFIAFLGGIVYAYRRQRQVFFWLSFFIISLLPMLTPFGISWIVAERYVYLGAIGIFVVVALSFSKLMEIESLKPWAIALFSLIILALSIRTIARNADWKNQDTLWLATARTSPSSPQNHNNLGDLYGRQGEDDKAVAEFKRAIELKPGYADAHHNLANTYQQMGKVPEAIENYQQAAEFNPNLWQSHQNLAAIYFAQEKFALAEENMKRAIEANPQNANLYLNLGIIYLRMENEPRAEEFFQKARRLDPQIPIPPIESAQP